MGVVTNGGKRRFREAWSWALGRSPHLVRDVALATVTDFLERGSLTLPVPDRVRLVKERGRVGLRFDYKLAPYRQLAAFFEGLARYGDLVRSCPRCRKPFLREGKRVYDTRACEAAARQSRWRERQRGRRRGKQR